VLSSLLPLRLALTNLLLLVACCRSVCQCVVVSEHPNMPLEKPMSYFVDTTAQLPFEEVLNSNWKPYRRSAFPSFLMGEYLHRFWFKVCLQNASNTKQEWLFTIGDVYRQDVYLSTPKRAMQHVICSQDLRISTNSYPFDHKYLPVSISPNETITLYIRVEDQPGRRFFLQPQLIRPTDEYLARLGHLYNERLPFAINVFLNSILFFVAVFVGVQYLIIRQKHLFYYALYVWCMMGFHLYGFSFSSYVKTPFSFIPALLFDLRQNFYVIITQIFYMLFLRAFFQIEDVGTAFQKKFFEYIHYIFLVLLCVELFFTFVYRRLDFELANILFTQFFIIIISFYLLRMLFGSSNLRMPLSIKLANLTLLIGVIVGFLSATLEWVKTSSPLLMYYPNYFFNFCVLTEIFLYSLGIAQLYFRNISEKSTLTHKLALAELNTLRSQMNPHFLFNSLNTIKNLIIKNQNQDASLFLSDLSGLLRTILHKSREQFLSLEDELNFTEEYIKLEQKRFSKHFIYSISVESKDWLLGKMMPSFLLQPFVENSIKHGFGRLEHQGKISINVTATLTHMNIEITDNGVGRINAAKVNYLTNPTHTSIGTTLIEERISTIKELYGWDIQLHITDLYDPTGTKVTINIPYFE
jgi:sensor histidine kinase YesM